MDRLNNYLIYTYISLGSFLLLVQTNFYLHLFACRSSWGDDVELSWSGQVEMDWRWEMEGFGILFVEGNVEPEG
jgi:hypothetical protein